MDVLDAVVQITVASIGAGAGAWTAITVAKIQAKKQDSDGPKIPPDRGKGDDVPRKKRIGSRKTWISTALGALVALAALNSIRVIAQPEPSTTLNAPSPIEDYYYPSGWMGDGEQGTENVQLNAQWRENPHSSPVCVRVSYQPSSKGWAGVYWQFPDGNWGDEPGRTIKGATKLSFWARGQKGGELVEFKAGGINAPGKKYVDSFARTLGPVELQQEWLRFEIPLRGADTSSVLGAFAWIASRDGNPDGLTFFVDDIRYE